MEVKTNLRQSSASTGAPRNAHTHTLMCKHAQKHIYTSYNTYTQIQKKYVIFVEIFFLLIFKMVPILLIFTHFIKGYLINGTLNMFINI